MIFVINLFMDDQICYNVNGYNGQIALLMAFIL